MTKMTDDFYAAVEIAKKIEKGALEHTNFSDKIEVVKSLDFEPREFEDLNYQDLVAMYQTIEKIISTAKILGGAQAPVTRAERAKTEEVETKVKEITTASLESVEELAKEIEKPRVEEIGIAKTERTEDISLLDFEAPSKERQEIEIEKPVEVKRPIEKIEREKVEIAKTIEETKPIEEKAGVGEVAVPAILETSAQEAADTKYKEIEEYLSREWGGAIEAEKVRKKMLDLTKDLFREKTTSGRERIKLEITVLKNMLGRVKEGKTKLKTAAPKTEYSQNVLETIRSTQRSELSSIKDEIQASISKQTTAIKNRFFDLIKGLSDDNINEKKAAYEKLVFDLTALNEQLPEVLRKSEEFLIQKHSTELKNLTGSVEKDAKVAKETQTQLDQLAGKYKREFSNLRSIVSKNIDSITEAAANEIFGREEKEAKTAGAVYEINETDEGTLLYYLHSKDADYYKKYERNHISKTEALHRSKTLMAKEKGLSADAISKYFGNIESED